MKIASGLKWPYILKLTGFAITLIVLVLVLLLAETSRRIVANLVVWDCPQPGHTPADIGLQNFETVQLEQELPADEAPAGILDGFPGAAIPDDHLTGTIVA